MLPDLTFVEKCHQFNAVNSCVVDHLSVVYFYTNLAEMYINPLTVLVTHISVYTCICMCVKKLCLCVVWLLVCVTEKYTYNHFDYNIPFNHLT